MWLTVSAHSRCSNEQVKGRRACCLLGALHLTVCALSHPGEVGSLVAVSIDGTLELGTLVI